VTASSVLVFLMIKRIDISQAYRITIIAFHLGVFQNIVNFLGESLWLKSIEKDKLY
jgi:hypothetical protein